MAFRFDRDLIGATRCRSDLPAKVKPDRFDVVGFMKLLMNGRNSRNARSASRPSGSRATHEKP